MKKSSILFAILILCFLCIRSQGLQAAPLLEIEGGITFDFGDVQINQTLKHTFILKNIGDRMLKIEQAKGG